MKQGIGRAVLTAALALALCTPAGAVSGLIDPDYTGGLDPYTGLPAGSASQTAGAGASVSLGGYTFDRDKQRYVIQAGSYSFTSSVPPGVILNKDGEASFELPGQLTGALYKNGDLVDQPDLSRVAGAGSYLLRVRGAGSQDEASFSFTIQSGLTRSLVEYTLPEGFTFTSVNVNGKEVSAGYSNYIEFLEEGEYSLQYGCEQIGRSYSLSFTLDRTPPVLALPQVEDGQAHGPVTLEDLEPGARVRVEVDGESEESASADTVLRQPGRYTLTAWDQAGNSSTYSFIIHFYLNISAATALGLAAAAIGGLIFYSRWLRRHARVG